MDIDLKHLEEMVREGYVQVQKHPELDLYIYNYSSKAQYDRVWNETTLQCRGLILNEEGEVVARPFRKFFNLGEMENQIIPAESFEVYEKLDGSLGILYWHDGKPFIATRGSFTSVQAAKANEILLSRYRRLIADLDPSKTYLFEIIYPGNRIVVDYGEAEELILIGVIDTITGSEHELSDIGFPVVRKYHGVNDIHSLKELQEDNKEGFVIKFSGGLRYKVKFDEYVRIHRIITQVSSISIWEYLREGKTLDELLDRVPDEFYNWVKKTNLNMLEAFRKIEEQARAEFREFPTRKETAMYFHRCKFPSVMFHMLDKKDYSDVIWKMLRPPYERPFANNEELS